MGFLMEPPNNTTKYSVVSFLNNKLSILQKLFAISLILVVLVLLFTETKVRQFKIDNFEWFGLVWKQTDELFQPTCVNVLDRAVVGHWVGREVTPQEVEELNNFYKMSINNLTVQRADGRCGTASIDGSVGKGALPLRALCEPNGTLPCCFEYKCVSKPVEQCRCKHCYDLRPLIHAELSTWIPADPTCKILEFDGQKDTCKLLKDVTIYFIGDSFMRHLYISVLSLVRQNNLFGPLRRNATSEQMKRCGRYFIERRYCFFALDLDPRECDNRTRLMYRLHMSFDENNKTVEYMAELQGQPNTFVIFGSGIHQGFKADFVKNQMLKPILSQLSKSPWPVPIWLSTHSVGLLKPYMLKSQHTENVVKYNHIINDFLRRNRIPTWTFTR